MGKKGPLKNPLNDLKKALELLEAKLHLTHDERGKENEYIKKHLDKLWEMYQEFESRVSDVEVQVNLLTRLITTLSLENLGIELKAFRRLIQRMEKELREDSEIAHLESLFQLTPKDPGHQKLLSKKSAKKPDTPPENSKS